jgi:hypothetical protein
MVAYLVLLLAVLSRILPHAFHAVSWNFTAVGGGLLFFGARMKDAPTTGRKLARLSIALAALIATDYYLTAIVFSYPFRPSHYAVTWIWYAAVCLLGLGLLKKPTVLRIVCAAFASATSFFLVSNFMVWVGVELHLYPHTLAGLADCYALALPFYRNDLVSTALVAGALFGLPVLAAKLAETMHAAQESDLPIA